MSLTLITFMLLIYNRKKIKNEWDKIYLIFSLLFSVFLFIRSEPMISFFNLCATLGFGLLLLIPYQKAKMGFLDFIYAPFMFMIRSVFIRSDYGLEFKEKKENFKKIQIGELAVSILITIFLLAIVLPLLTTTNPFFQKLITDILKVLSLENLLQNIGIENIFIWLIRAVFFFLFLFIIPKIITLINKSGDYSLPFNQKTVPLGIPKLILASVLLIFFITQFQLYMADEVTLKNLGLSHSQYAREVFGQLCVVAGLVFLLIFNDKNKAVLNKTLNWVLGIQGLFLTLMAFKSDFEYINAWGLTYIRLYGITLATWIMGIFILFFYNYKKEKPAFKFVKSTIIFSATILFLVNILNFDYLIYHYRKAATGQGIDYTYLSNLSPDSQSYKSQFEKLEIASKAGSYKLEDYNNKNPLIILYKIESLQGKYSDFDLRTFNLSDYWQYRQIKDVDTAKLRALYSNPDSY